jgi:hypothetical protein
MHWHRAAHRRNLGWQLNSTRVVERNRPVRTQDLTYAVDVLTTYRTSIETNAEVRRIYNAETAALAQFGPVFQPGCVESLDLDVFREFLRFGGNRHWSGLARNSGRLTSDPIALRSGLVLLVDPRLPLPTRVDGALAHVSGLGRGIATGILLFAQPDAYGVWNGPSGTALRRLRALPPNAGTTGERYLEVNGVLLRLASAMRTSLWRLDADLWWVASALC